MGKPCYTFQESNIVIIQAFKEACALLFCKGALLNDPKGMLEKPGENTRKSTAAAACVFTLRSGKIVKGGTRLKSLFIHEANAAKKAKASKGVIKKDLELECPRNCKRNWMQPRLQNRLRCPDARPAKSLHPVLLRSQTIQNAGGEDLKMPAPISPGKGIERSLKRLPNARHDDAPFIIARARPRHAAGLGQVSAAAALPPEASEALAWYASLGFPDAKDLSYVRVATGAWHQSGNHPPANRYAEGLLVSEEAGAFTIFIQQRRGF